MLSVSMLLLFSATQDAPVTLPHRVVAPWTIEMGPGSVKTEQGVVQLTEPVQFTIDPAFEITLTDQPYESLPVFNPQAGGWMKGARLRELITAECTATGKLRPDTLRVKPAPGDAAPFNLGTDYELDPVWGTFGRVEGGAIAPDQTVYVDFEYAPDRLDALYWSEDGSLVVAGGEPGVGVLSLPAGPEGAVHVGSVWVPGNTESLDTGTNLYMVDFALEPLPAPAEGPGLANTLRKLRAGEPVTVVAWGDSVTAGGGLENPEERYQAVFIKKLRKRFPRSEITLIDAGWGGASSRQYLDAPEGGTHDFKRDVLEPKPDLVTIEFVNDAGLDEAGVERQYTEILGHLHGAGAEVVLITPHLVRPDWMPVESARFDEDPRPYVRGLRQFAQKHGVALADASLWWTRLNRQGVPYMTLMNNSINHPDPRGHRFFAEALLALFPE
jgi:lysophospholipase L1-like esterase